MMNAFTKHVLDFLNAHYPGHAKHVAIAVSGGVDSFVLLSFAYELYQKGHLQSLRAVGVNHHTRTGQDRELERVFDWARKRNIEVQCLHREGSVPKSDLEHQLRAHRHQLLKNSLKEGEELWMGHHLNDSWEWSQLQRARSSEVRSALGIPLKSGRTVRPFLCVTREQIVRVAKLQKLPWSEDPTNAGTEQARFWFRHVWAPQLEAEHPQFLKHYARHAQRLAESLGVALKKKSEARRIRHEKAQLFVGIPSVEQVTKAVRELSHSTRGSLGREVPKILKALSSGKRGPFQLSGGVKAHLFGDWLLLTAQSFQNQDRELGVVCFRDWTRQEFVTLLEKSLNNADLVYGPFWVAFDPDQKHRNTLIACHNDPLWPELTTKDASWPVISGQKLLSRWKDSTLTLRISPLWYP